MVGAGGRRDHRPCRHAVRALQRPRDRHQRHRRRLVATVLAGGGLARRIPRRADCRSDRLPLVRGPAQSDHRCELPDARGRRQPCRGRRMDLVEGFVLAVRKGISRMHHLMPAGCGSAAFDEPSLGGSAGLVPAGRLGEAGGFARAGPAACDRAGRGWSRGRGEGVLRWSRGWWPGRTASTTWMCCGTAGWAGCSPGCGRRRRWGRSCGRSRFGHVRQLDAVAARFLAGLAGPRRSCPGGR